MGRLPPTLGAMNNNRYLYRSNLYGGLGIPPELQAHLPPLLRYRYAFFDIPMSLAAIAALVLDYALLGSALLVGVASVSIASFWVAKSSLARSGKWIPGTWHAEVLPGIYRARAVFFLLLVLSGCGAYLVLGAHIVTPFLTVPTVLALVMAVPAYLFASIKQGYIGTVGNIDYRSEKPTRFWLGLLFYSTVIGLSAAVVVFLLIRVTYGP